MLMFFVGFLQIISVFLESVWSLRISGKIAVSGSGVFLWKLLRLPMEFYSQRLAGDLLKRQDTNATIADTLVGTFAPLLIHAGMMVLYLFLMLWTSVLLTAVGAAAMLLHLLVSQIIAAKRVNITRVRLRDSGRLAAATLSGIQMAETIKAAGAENGFFAQWSGIQAAMNRQNVRYSFLNRSLGMIPSALSALAGALVLILGVLLTMQGRFTLGMILLFQGFLNGFMDPVRTIITAGQSLQEMRSDMERIEDVLAYPDDPAFAAAPADGTEEYAKLSGDVELRNVTFGYSPLEPPLIRDFSMHVKPGSRVAFVGPSGCGKSTLAKLISGLYRPWSGEILFDKKPASSIDRSVFTGSVAVADQEIILFEGTVADNIRMWDTSIEDFEMILAARDAQIYDDIMAREGGFSAQLTEGGKDLSGGQRQRIEIARVLAQDPSIIIMDEATSALDAKTEYELVKAVKDRGITCIVIAHRLSTIRDCDEIIVLDKGKVVERGTHEELYAKGGYYSELISND
jgi:ABC-type bacteriocin/lantibiotic exporter with double-glycine peptidase domain